MESLYFITANSMKAREAREILAKFGIEIQQRMLEIDEIQDKDAERVAKRKALDSFRMIKKPLIVEDTGLYIHAMNGYPGTLIKHFFNSIGPQGILEYLHGKDRSAEAVTVVACCDSTGKVKTFRGKVAGRISEYVADGYNFAWDRIFVPAGYDKTYAEIGAEVKNRISQRRLALHNFARWVQGRKI